MKVKLCVVTTPAEDTDVGARPLERETKKLQEVWDSIQREAEIASSVISNIVVSTVATPHGSVLYIIVYQLMPLKALTHPRVVS